MSKIIVEDILKKHRIVSRLLADSSPESVDKDLKAAIKEIVELALDKAKEIEPINAPLIEAIKKELDYE